MQKIAFFAATAASVLLSIGPTQAAPQDNWGQQVKSCNQSNCYPDGTSRGAYVRQQATDDQGPGYGYEIQTLALPGNGDGPKSDNFSQ